MVGAGLPPTVGGGVVTPASPSPSVLDPAEMRNLMAGNATPSPGTANAAQPTTAVDGQGRVTFALPDNLSRATLLNKLQEHEREQEDEDNMAEFMKTREKTRPKTKKEFGEWISRVGEPVAVVAMVHNKKHVQIASNVMQYAASCRADNAWRCKMFGALGDRNEEEEDPPFVRLKPSSFAELCNEHF